jgi:sporulation protein YlmC with PRC-barrel domain
MKRTFSMFAVLILLVLAACGPASTTETPGLPDATDPFLTETETSEIPPVETPGETPMPDVTEAPTTEPTVTEPAATEAITSTEVIPPTGLVDPGRVTNLMDFLILNQDGEPVAKTADLVLNLGESQVNYVVASTGGYLETGDRLIAVPWQAVEVQTQPTTALVLTVDQESFEAAPDLDLAAIPALGEVNTDWDADIHDYWSTVTVTDTMPTATPDSAAGDPAKTETPDASMAGDLVGVTLATDFIGMGYQIDGEAATGQYSATVDDVIIDVETGEILYAVILVDLQGAGQRLIPIPLDPSLIGWDAVNSNFTLSVDLVALSGAPSYEAGSLPDTQQTDWDAELREFWEALKERTSLTSGG